MTEKTCSICKLAKPLSEYHKDSASTAGRRSNCKICANTRNVEIYTTKIPPELVAKRKRLEEQAAAGVKTCNECGLTKLLGEFGKKSKSPDSYQSICKTCINAANTKYYEKNREAVLARDKEYREINKEAFRAYGKKYYEENRETLLAYAKDYSKNNLHISRESDRRRRARKLKNVVERYTEAQALELYGTDCHICKEPVDLNAPRRGGSGEGWERGLHLDHLISLFNGGADSLENIRPSHGLCNIRKNRN